MGSTLDWEILYGNEWRWNGVANGEDVGGGEGRSVAKRDSTLKASFATAAVLCGKLSVMKGYD